MDHAIIAKMGGDAVKKKYGLPFFKIISDLATVSRKKKKEERLQREREEQNPMGLDTSKQV